MSSLADVLCLVMVRRDARAIRWRLLTSGQGLAQKDNLIYLAISQCVGNHLKASFNRAALAQPGGNPVISNINKSLDETYHKTYSKTKEVEVNVRKTQLTDVA
ncbi:hypothetical protein D9619_012817 [Psilocybe cf. subviscida]|uniref:Uncharacterized protein n=1 Tax=Psilocybe cf. subviscida TaxID=2480587 RepID=A0A8H5AQU2_9AGAR|nr:hypothetical protein D9619_012817 [Psilocybe cf. subviscida]